MFERAVRHFVPRAVFSVCIRHKRAALLLFAAISHSRRAAASHSSISGIRAPTAHQPHGLIGFSGLIGF
jgi:hypothetical protein